MIRTWKHLFKHTMASCIFTILSILCIVSILSMLWYVVALGQGNKLGSSHFIFNKGLVPDPRVLNGADT